MDKKYFTLVIILIVFVISIKSTFAYIGPGTGSVIANTLWPLIVTVGSVIIIFSGKYLWKPVKSAFSRLTGMVKKKE